jgi:MarR family transcriptional regulator for hemolysin
MVEPDSDPVLLINDVARLIRTEADRRARRYDLTRAQWIILARVQRTPGLSQRELAELLEVEPITVGRLVDRLEAGELVERRSDPIDRRMWRLHLRPAAGPLLAKLGVQKEELVARALEGVAEPELAGLVAALRQIRANMAVCRREPATAVKEAV